MVHMYFSYEQTLSKNIPCTFLHISAQWRRIAACGSALFNRGLFLCCSRDSNADPNCAGTNCVDQDVLHLPETRLPLPLSAHRVLESKACATILLMN